MIYKWKKQNFLEIYPQLLKISSDIMQQIKGYTRKILRVIAQITLIIINMIYTVTVTIQLNFY